MSSQQEPQFRLAEIEVSNATVDERTIGMFRFESDAKGRKGPLLIIFAEIASTLYAYEQLLDVLTERAEQVRHLVAGVDTDPMARFEKTVQHLNEAVAGFLRDEPSPITWNRVNIFILQCTDGHLCFTGIGRLMNLFLQKQKDGAFRSFDLFGSLEQPAEVDPAKPFVSLVCGDLQPGDVLFLGTTNLERLRNELRIPERLKTLPPVTSALEIRQDLEARKIPDDFAALVIANVTLPGPATASAPPSHEPAKERSTASVEKMREQEQHAQAMLSPNVAPRPTRAPAAKWKEAVTRVTASVGKVWSAERIRAKDAMAMASLRGMNAGHGSFMTPKRKMMAGVILAALVLVGGGIGWYRRHERFLAEQELWNTAFSQATDKKSRAEADLVYGNEDRARGLLKEATDLAAGLDEGTADRKTTKTQLANELAEMQNKLKREVRVDQPTELTTLALGSAEDSLQTLALFKGKIVSIDTAGGAAVSVDPISHETKRIAISGLQGAAQGLTAGQDTLALALANRAFYAVDPARGLANALTVSMEKASSARAIALYNRRLYVLDPPNNMIWKYSPSGGGFAQETPYLKQNSTNLSEAAGIAIDSNVYVAFQDGRLIRYYAGAEETWPVSTIEPALEHAQSVWTTADTDRIAVADPVGKRIVVFRKDGKLVAQIVSAAFKNPRDVTGDDQARKLYVVDSNRILQFDLP